MDVFRDPFYRIVDSEIVIPGVAGTHTLMQVSDLHLAVSDELSDEEERETAASREANWMTLREDFTRWHSEPFDDSKRIPSAKVLEKIFALAEAMRPDVLLMTGDMLDFVGPAGVRAMRAALAGYGGRLIYVDGNHDAGTGGVRGGGAEVARLDGFNVVGVNNGGLTVSDAELAELKALCAEGTPLIVAQHVPALTEASREKIAGFGEYFYIDADSEKANAAEFVRLERDEEAVKAVLCGHLHCFVRSEIAPGKPQLCASSVLCGFIHRITIRGTREVF
ncbi:MAG: metallophosphoesterase [Clostridia bacterium]|nr:metallophosphoesterase [Clostridia bacterium]